MFHNRFGMWWLFEASWHTPTTLAWKTVAKIFIWDRIFLFFPLVTWNEAIARSAISINIDVRNSRFVTSNNIGGKCLFYTNGPKKNMQMSISGLCQHYHFLTAIIHIICWYIVCTLVHTSRGVHHNYEQWCLSNLWKLYGKVTSYEMWFSLISAFTCSPRSSVQTLVLPLFSSSWIFESFPNPMASLPHISFTHCDGPYVSHNWWWIFAASGLLAVRNLITDRTSQLMRLCISHKFTLYKWGNVYAMWDQARR